MKPGDIVSDIPYVIDRPVGSAQGQTTSSCDILHTPVADHEALSSGQKVFFTQG
jgi:hypothetical protein